MYHLLLYSFDIDKYTQEHLSFNNFQFYGE